MFLIVGAGLMCPPDRFTVIRRRELAILTYRVGIDFAEITRATSESPLQTTATLFNQSTPMKTAQNI